METDNGFIVIHRKMLKTSFFKNPSCSHLVLYLLLKANHEQKKFIFNKQEIILERGQLITGRKTLSEETGLSEQTLRTSLTILKNINFLTSKSTNKYSIITIVNYSKYQDKKFKITSKSTNDQPATNQQLTTNNNTNNNENNENKNINNIIIYNSDFETFWNKYPSRNGNKAGKKAAYKLFKDIIKTKDNYTLLLKAVDNYSKSKNARQGYARDAVRFFKEDYWHDWIDFKDEETQKLLEIEREKEEYRRLIKK